MAKIICAICGDSVPQVDTEGLCSRCSNASKKDLFSVPSEIFDDFGVGGPQDSMIPPLHFEPNPKRQTDFTSSAMLSMTEAPNDQLSGQVLGGCRIKSRIGGGSMGDVYLAEQLSLGRRVAVKVLRSAEALRPQFLARFRVEARIIAALNHPNIVQVYDVGSENGLHFIIMEFVDGPSLRILMREGITRNQGLCRQLLTQALEGLGAAHEQGIIHRDVKPDNLLVAGGRQVKLVDFGLAKNVEGDEKLTAMGTILGTPEYMSPEAGRGDDVDIRSDLYSLGATFYHVISGHFPFKADTPLGVLYRQIHDPLTSLRKMRPDADPSLAAVIETLMAKEPRDRYQTCEEALEALNISPIAISADERPRPAASSASRTSDSAFVRNDQEAPAWRPPKPTKPVQPEVPFAAAPPAQPVPPAVASTVDTEEAPTRLLPETRLPPLPPAKPKKALQEIIAEEVTIQNPVAAAANVARDIKAQLTANEDVRRTVDALSKKGKQAAEKALEAKRKAGIALRHFLKRLFQFLIVAGLVGGIGWLFLTPSGNQILDKIRGAKPATALDDVGEPLQDEASLSADESTLWLRTNEFLEHVTTGSTGLLMDYLGPAKGKPVRDNQLEMHLTKFLKLPERNQIEGFKIVRVQVQPTGEEGMTRIAFQVKGKGLWKIDLRWKLLDDQWKAVPG